MRWGTSRKKCKDIKDCKNNNDESTARAGRALSFCLSLPSLQSFGSLVFLKLYVPTASRSASEPGSPALRMRCWASPMG